eukprot:TRINITY_DN1230_c0_g1_i2.p1 TRINITY_DN1230_c0_g1~~TRINITY_DN1230_c0_g1_i2.p1  ORF type:complete len:156 (-),score=17.00 TRINITY_DN1230_c0_g1_i2:140-607(-)
MTQININYYRVFIPVVKKWAKYDITKIIYVDEKKSHFDRRRLNFKYGWSPPGNPNIFIDDISLDKCRFNLSLLITLKPPNQESPCYFVVRKAKNTANKFIIFLRDAYLRGYLSRGDVIILDNARVHNAIKIRRILVPWLAARGIQLMSLPTFSPE